LVAGVLAGALTGTATASDEAAVNDAGRKLLAAYPDHLDRIDAGALVWRDGTRMTLRRGRPDKPFAEWLAAPDLADMLAKPYAVGQPASAPPVDFDPGRARNQAFFDKMYGGCAARDARKPGAPKPGVRPVTWLPAKASETVWVTTVNGVDRRLEAVSAALDRLGAAFDVYLAPSAGTLNCRAIAGTTRTSPHSYGIAIDIALARADYWGWGKPNRDGRYPFRNRIPLEIVTVFETHGFIWGGRWYHYDTMHFEYRPELLPVLPPLP
jgi:hypothetical protein